MTKSRDLPLPEWRVKKVKSVGNQINLKDKKEKNSSTSGLPSLPGCSAESLKSTDRRKLGFLSTAHAGGSTRVYSTEESSSKELHSSVSREKMYQMYSKSTPFYSSVQMRKEQELTFGWGEWAHANFIDVTQIWDAAPETPSKTNEKEKSIQLLLKFQRKFSLITVLLTMHEIGLFQKDWGRFHYIHRLDGQASYFNNYIRTWAKTQQTTGLRESSVGRATF